jgi:hypothetical protein
MSHKRQFGKRSKSEIAKLIFWLVAILTLEVSVGREIAAGPPKPTDIQTILTQDYSQYNERWFKNRLPTDTVIQYYSMPDFDIGQTNEDDGHYHIFVNSYYNRDKHSAEFTLFHEMCHVEVNLAGEELETHGSKWQGCMLRLANAGAFHDVW